MKNIQEKPSLADIYKKLKSLEKEKLKDIRIQILRNITIHPIEPFIKYYCANSGYNSLIKFGEFDTILQDANNISDDIVIIFLTLENFSKNLHCKFNSLSENQIKNEIQHVIDYIQTTISMIRKKSGSPIIFTDFIEPIFPSYGLLDCSILKGEKHNIQKLNFELRNLVSTNHGVFILPLNQIANKIGHNNFFDIRQWYLSTLPYSKDGLQEIAKLISVFVSSLNGSNKKCLVLDCDNVLWGGILGEDGPDGIKIDKNFPGSEYYSFQNEILNLYNRGIILTLCSKNNEKDVIDLLNSNSNILIKEKHLSAYRINWQEKDKNIVELSNELNISLDSMVFIDDSKFEIELIKQSLPMVETIDLSEVNALKFAMTLKEYRGFDSLSISQEDKKRGIMYKEQAKRNSANVSFTNLEDYLNFLEIELNIQIIDNTQISRVAQLTQRTNQFNLTTKRYSESQIKELKIKKNSDIFTLKVKDKFGDLGIVGAAIILYDNQNNAIIENLLISCRALGRKIEFIFVAEIYKFLLNSRMKKEVFGIYKSSEKNSQTSDFYKNFGNLVKQSSLEKFINHSNSKIFIFDLEKPNNVSKLKFKVSVNI